MPNDTLFMKITQVLVTWPDGSQQTYPLDDMTRVGRGPDNQILVPDQYKSVSRKHLALCKRSDGYYVIDLGGQSGVTLNGVKVTEALLKDRDEISIGQAVQNHQIRIVFQQGTELTLARMAAEGPSEMLAGLDLPTEEPVGQAHLRIRWPNGRVNYFTVVKRKVVIGRDAGADLRIPERYRFVSNHHAEIQWGEGGFLISDLKSTNGTFLNNHRLEAFKPQPLNDGAILRIGDEAFGISIGITFVNKAGQPAALEGFSQRSEGTKLIQTKTIMIGREMGCDIVLASPEVSRKHASIREMGGSYILQDMNSSNGTWLNDQPVTEAKLQDGDLIKIHTYVLLFQQGKVIPYESQGLRVDVRNLSREVGPARKKRRILDTVNMSVLPREFIAIVGGSGAGKSTLLNALIGIRPGDGQVSLNGHDFYKEYDSFRSQLGFVPQADILHGSLTVEKALEYAVKLRLPPNIDAAERQRLINSVLDTVSMNTEAVRKTKIRNLSGGQRKRISIASELLADPKLIYLDEATSGLDPGLEKKMMYTLRKMADEGRTVILITHATNNIVQTDHVAFISEGKLVFFGTSDESLDFFEVEDFADIYERIERHGAEWREVFEQKKPANFKKYIQERLSQADAVPKQVLKKARFGVRDFFRQLVVLTQRSLNVLFSDPITLVLMVLLLPITGVLQLIVGSKDILTGNLGIMADPIAAAKTMVENYIPFARTNTFLFVIGLEAVLTGLFEPSNDLVKERSVFLRERMVNLKVLPYLLSKAVVYSLFVLVQVILYLVILSLGVNLPEQGLFFPGYIEMFITLFLTMMAGITFGLIISAMSKSTEMAIYLLVMLVFFQFFFAGTVFDLRENKFEPLSYLSTTRWSLTALGVTIDLPEIVSSTILCSEVPENPLNPNSPTQTVCSNYPAATEDLMINYDEEMLLNAWGILLGMSVLFMTITGILLHRMNSE